MYMDLTDMISGGTEEQQIPEQKLTKEEYAAKKQQEREEVWAEVDSQAQGVFQDGEKLKGFLDFMAECNTQRTPNLLLIYGQHPDFKVVRSYERWREEHRSVKAGEHGITYMISRFRYSTSSDCACTLSGRSSSICTRTDWSFKTAPTSSVRLRCGRSSNGFPDI